MFIKFLVSNIGYLSTWWINQMLTGSESEVNDVFTLKISHVFSALQVFSL